jgi:hypothetical protein
MLHEWMGSSSGGSSVQQDTSRSQGRLHRRPLMPTTPPLNLQGFATHLLCPLWALDARFKTFPLPSRTHHGVIAAFLFQMSHRTSMDSRQNTFASASLLGLLNLPYSWHQRPLNRTFEPNVCMSHNHLQNLEASPDKVTAHLKTQALGTRHDATAT